MPIEFRNPSSLKPHQVSLGLYGEIDVGDLRESIEELGILVPIVIMEGGMIISGCRRWKTAMELGMNEVPVEVECYTDEWGEKRAILEYNRYRRKTITQMMKEAKLLKELIAAGLFQRQILSSGIPKSLGGIELDPITKTFTLRQNLAEGLRTTDLVSQEIGLGSGETFRKVEKVYDKAKEGNETAINLLTKLDSGETTIDRAYRQLEIETRKESRPPLPQLTFGVIYADPPWEYEFSKSDSRSIEAHYPSMSVEEICELPVPVEEDAILFLWATSPKLEEALRVIEAWGFEYRTNMVWVKGKQTEEGLEKQIGMGYYCREQHELLLIARKGDIAVPDPANRPGSVIIAPRTEHSIKPEEVYEIIECMYPNQSKIELFARKARPGWISWGEEIPEEQENGNNNKLGRNQ